MGRNGGFWRNCDPRCHCVSSNSDGRLDDHYKGALPPGSIGNRSVVPLIAFLLSLEANRPRCHQLPKCERRNGLMGLSLIEPLVLKEEQ